MWQPEGELGSCAVEDEDEDENKSMSSEATTSHSRVSISIRTSTPPTWTNFSIQLLSVFSDSGALMSEPIMFREYNSWYGADI